MSEFVLSRSACARSALPSRAGAFWPAPFLCEPAHFVLECAMADVLARRNERLPQDALDLVLLLRARPKYLAALLQDDSRRDASLGRYERLPQGALDLVSLISARAKCCALLWFGEGMCDVALLREKKKLRMARCRCALFRPTGPGTMLQQATQAPEECEFQTFRCFRCFRFPF